MLVTESDQIYKGGSGIYKYWLKTKTGHPIHVKLVQMVDISRFVKL